MLMSCNVALMLQMAAVCGVSKQMHLILETSPGRMAVESIWLLQLWVLFEYSDQQNPFRCPSVQSAGYSCSRVLLTGLPCSAICLGDWQDLVCLQAEELMAWVGRCCAARSGVKCLCRTVHAPCSDRTVSMHSPEADNNQTRT